MMEVICGRSNLFCELPEYNGNFLVDAKNVVGKLFNIDVSRLGADGKDRDSVKIHKFLNRLLGVKVNLQNAIYQFYTNILDHFVKEAKFSGKYDFGIVDLGRNNEFLQQQTKKEYKIQSSSGYTTAELIGFNVERGITFDEAKVLVEKCGDPESGFYMSKDVRGHYRQCMLILASGFKDSNRLYTCSRPNTGLGKKTDTLDNLSKNYFRVDNHNVIEDWNRFYKSTQNSCIHQYFHGSCKALVRNGDCDVGKRVKTIYLLCGAIFSLWSVIEATFGNSPIRMARVTTQDGCRRIGVMIPKPFIPRLTARLDQTR
uniref:Protein strawberry notch homolog 1 (Trinotate prediction) n=1 Tax=Henneguya salminicola TaxID=69463 RepID=A0A6G3MG66_HENSL